MKELKEEIEKAGNSEFPYNEDEFSWITDDKRNAFILGAESIALKEYWQKGMYSEDEVKVLIQKFNKEQCASIWYDDDEEWFEQNKKQ